MNDNNGKILALDKPFSGVKKVFDTLTKKEATFFPRKKYEKSSNTTSAWHTIHRDLIE